MWTFKEVPFLSFSSSSLSFVSMRRSCSSRNTRMFLACLVLSMRSSAINASAILFARSRACVPSRDETVISITFESLIGSTLVLKRKSVITSLVSSGVAPALSIPISRATLLSTGVLLIKFTAVAMISPGRYTTHSVRSPAIVDCCSTLITAFASNMSV